MMTRRILANPIVFLLIVAGPSLVWAKKSTASLEAPPSNKAVSESNSPKSSSVQIQPSESKVRTRYTGRHPDNHYILEEDHDNDGGHQGAAAKEFVEDEGNEEYSEEEHDRGYHNEDKKLDDETLKKFGNKGTDQDFKEGGASFDKHHKDRASENKENEHVNEHDEGEKFGAEALKEHKLGKHREKSIGHKKHGFKNVYHKEEYGDHKTFHDEFLDNDHHHEYDDQHENRKLEGGRFSKGYLREGENKELDEGDEKHAWGKGGHDSQHEGHYEEGGHLTGRHQGHKKHEGHHEASGQKNKHSSYKVKKGEAPSQSSSHHHGTHNPQYYSRSYKSDDNKGHFSKVLSPEVAAGHIGGGHHQRQHYSKGSEPHAYQDSDHQSEGRLYPLEERSHARRLETTEGLGEHVHNLPETTPVVHQGHIPKAVAPPENHSFFHRRPQSVLDPIPLKEGTHAKKQEPWIEHQNHPVVQSSPQDSQPYHPSPQQHHPSSIFPTRLGEQSLRSGVEPHHLPDHRNHHHRHFVLSQPSRELEPIQHPHNHQHPSSVSKPYPWWKHSRTGKRHHDDSAQASSIHRFGRERAPDYYKRWVPQNKYRYSEPYYEQGASRPANVGSPEFQY